MTQAHGDARTNKIHIHWLSDTCRSAQWRHVRGCALKEEPWRHTDGSVQWFTQTREPLFLPWRTQLNVNRLHFMVVEVTLHFPKWRLKLCRGNNSLLTPKSAASWLNKLFNGSFLKQKAQQQDSTRASVKASEPGRPPHAAVHLKQTKRSHMWCE